MQFIDKKQESNIKKDIESSIKRSGNSAFLSCHTRPQEPDNVVQLESRRR